jgi:hypothetical protein
MDFFEVGEEEAMQYLVKNSVFVWIQGQTLDQPQIVLIAEPTHLTHLL